MGGDGESGGGRGKLLHVSRSRSGERAHCTRGGPQRYHLGRHDECPKVNVATRAGMGQER